MFNTVSHNIQSVQTQLRDKRYVVLEDELYPLETDTMHESKITLTLEISSNPNSKEWGNNLFPMIHPHIPFLPTFHSPYIKFSFRIPLSQAHMQAKIYI